MTRTAETVKTLVLGAAALAMLGVGSTTAAQVLAAPPAHPDPARHYLFYEHGRIVEGTDGRPVSPRFGPYEYREILDTLSAKGFVVISAIRPKGADVAAAAVRLAAQVEQLLAAGVPPSHVTLVGASKGGVIVLRASHRLDRPELRVVTLAGMFRSLAGNPKLAPRGAVLAVDDSADDTGQAPELYLEGAAGVPESRVVVTHLGLGHGLLFTPNDAWVTEVVRWSGIARDEARAP